MNAFGKFVEFGFDFRGADDMREGPGPNMTIKIAAEEDFERFGVPNSHFHTDAVSGTKTNKKVTLRIKTPSNLRYLRISAPVIIIWPNNRQSTDAGYDWL